MYSQLSSIPTLVKQKNLLLNGDFRNNNCTSTSCLCISSNYSNNPQNYVYNWFPTVYFYIGVGLDFNKLIGQSYVIKLTDSSSFCIQQNLTSNLTKGKY